jgi:starch phosphorylase
MVTEYRSELYDPAHAAFEAIQEGQFRAARERVAWSRRVAEVWPLVRFNDYGIGALTVSTGSSVALRAEVELAGLTSDDVRVEALVGRVGPVGDLEDVQVLVLEPQGHTGTAFLFGRDIVPYATGRLGFAVRVTPNHFEDPLNRPCNALLKWAGLRPGD